MRVLVTGGAGYIGSHAVRGLLTDSSSVRHEVTVLDNFSRGYRKAIHPDASVVEGSTGDQTLVRRVLEERRIEAVLHFAADIEVGESVENPGKYYRNNFANAIALLEAMAETKVQKLVFSSTAAVYGNPASSPVSETHAVAPINPYGRSKAMTESVLPDYAAAHGLGYAVLRYFNVAGASADGSIGEDHHPESHLIPRLLIAARDGGGSAKIFGTDYPTPDGTCVRDYIHVEDLVGAHLLALAAIRPGQGNTYNLGSENGFSVREVIRACESVTGRKISVTEEPRRGGDSATLVATSARIREELGWLRRYPELETIIAHAWRWHRDHPHGYRA